MEDIKKQIQNLKEEFTKKLEILEKRLEPFEIGGYAKRTKGLESSCFEEGRLFKIWDTKFLDISENHEASEKIISHSMDSCVPATKEEYDAYIAKKTKLEVSKWYRHRSLNALVRKMGERGTGINHNGVWTEEHAIEVDGNWEPASLEYIKERLSEEAQRRGIVSGAVIDKYPILERPHRSSNNNIVYVFGKYSYDEERDVLFVGSDGVYRDGKWAIVTEQIPVCGHNVEFREGSIKVGCTTIANDIIRDTFKNLRDLGVSSISVKTDASAHDKVDMSTIQKIVKRLID